MPFEQHGNLRYKIKPTKEQFIVEYPEEERGQILAPIIEWIEKKFEENRWGKPPKDLIEELKKGGLTEIKLLGNIKIKVGEKKCGVVGKNYRAVEELLVYLQQHT